MGDLPRERPSPFVPRAEGLFFLRRHHSGGFSELVEFVPKGGGRFAADLAAAKRYLGLLADPLGSLRGEEPADRLASAVLLLTHYQSTHGYMVRTAPIPAEENKLILAALAGADWDAAAGSPLDPWGVVYSMWRLSESKPGQVFKEPSLPKGTPAEQRAFLRDWVRKHQDTYRIERFVPE